MSAKEETVKELQNNPLYFIQNVLGENPWKVQLEIIEAVKNNKEVAVASCHAAGKSWISARIALWFTVSYYLARCVTTAPTFDQVKDILWQEIRRAYGSSLTPLGGRMLDTRFDLGPNWFATGRATNDSNHFQGTHSQQGHILVIADEASGIDPDIWVGIDGILTSEDSHLLAIGNPTEPSGEFFEMFKRPGVVKIHISAFDTPNFTTFHITLEDIRSGCWKEKINGPLPAPWLITPEWVADKWQKWGEDSPLWVSRVLGKFPEKSTDTLIPLSWIERAQHTRLEPADPIIVSADIARMGSDETVIGIRQGSVIRLHKITHQEDTMATTGRVIQALDASKATEARIDADGLGAGVYDRLIEQGKPAIEMRSGFAAQDHEHYANARAEWWFGLRSRFETGDIDLDEDEELAYQLSNLKYKINSRGQIVIESKEDMKKRGLHSPDRADMVMMAFASIPGPITSDWLPPDNELISGSKIYEGPY
jgi:phage terminase large subunit